MKKNNLLVKFNNFLDKITEPVHEVSDNGLNEDVMETEAMPVAQNMAPKEAPSQVKDAIKIFDKPKQQEVVPVAESSNETNNDLAQLLKTTPETNVTAISSDDKNDELQMDTFPVYNESVEKTELAEDDIFERNMNIGDSLFQDFRDSCFDTIEGIQSSELLSRDRKIEKMNRMNNELISLSEDDTKGFNIFFKKMMHELHMIDNKLGEYDKRVYDANLTNNSIVMNYKISEMHADEELFKYLLESDKESMNKLLALGGEVFRGAERCGCTHMYVSNAEQLINSANNVVDAMVAEEKIGDMLRELDFKLKTSPSTNSLRAQ